MELKRLQVSKIGGIDFTLSKKSEAEDTVIKNNISNVGQFFFPTVAEMKSGETMLLNFHNEVRLFQSLNKTLITCVMMKEVEWYSFRALRLAMCKVTRDIDPFLVSEEVSEIIRVSKDASLTGLSNRTGIELVSLTFYKELLEFDWTFKTKKENKKQINPDQVSLF